jgi:hypothetical protein
MTHSIRNHSFQRKSKVAKGWELRIISFLTLPLDHPFASCILHPAISDLDPTKSIQVLLGDVADVFTLDPGTSASGFTKQVTNSAYAGQEVAFRQLGN